MSLTPAALMAKIKEMYPEIGKYNLTSSLMFDGATNTWVLELVKDTHELHTHIDAADAEKCLGGVECVHLSHQIGQFIRTYCEGGSGCEV